MKIGTLVIIVFLFSCLQAWGQDGEAETPPTESDDPVLNQINAELARQKARTALAEEQQKEAEAEQAKLKAELPETETAGLPGDVTVKDGAGYYATILAYRTLNIAASFVVSQLPPSDHLLITTNKDVTQSAGLWNVTRIKLDNVKAIFKTLKDDFPCETTNRDGTVTRETDGPCTDDQKIGHPGQEAIASILTTLPALLGAADDVAAFFRTNRTIYNVSVELADEALIAEVAREANNEKRTVHIPGLSITGAGPLSQQLESLLADYRDLSERKRRLKEQFDPELKLLVTKRGELTKAETERKKLEDADATGNAERIQELTQQIATLTEAIFPLAARQDIWNISNARLQAPLAAFDALSTSLLTPPDKDKKSVMEIIAPIDIFAAQQGEKTVLYVEIVSQGGELHTTKRAFSQGRLHYLGGSVVVFFAVKPDGEFIASGMLPLTNSASFKASKGIEALN